jgi:phosphoribosylformylglycinamidine synthase
LALNLDEMRAIRDYFSLPETVAARTAQGLPCNPTDVEIEMLAQTWSEHCKHKIFNAKVLYEDEETGGKDVIDGVFRTYIRAATEEAGKKVDWLISVFEDNAGVVAFNDRLNVVAKVETHNTPSALEPYGGALTGIVGVNRDPLGTGKGAKLMFNVFTYCFGSPFYDGRMPPRMLHPRRIRDGVHKGVIDGGNQSGIPLARGREVYDPRYGEKGGKPLVYCGTVGIMPRLINGEGSEVKRVVAGDYIVMVGGRIGKDGIHGATFSSEELHKGSPVQAVQIGDPITQKKMSDLLLEARDLGLYRAITDNGAGGLSSSIGEMARLCGGCEVWLERAPLKYEGLDPWEILLSEAQERMTLAVDPARLEEFLALARRRDVEATVLGKFTDSGKFHAKYGDWTVAFLDMSFLHEGVPQKSLKAVWKRPRHEEPNLPEPDDYNQVLKEMLGRLNVCSIEKKLRQYDHEVKGLSVVKPLVGKEYDCPSDASVNILEYGSKEGLIIAEGICPHYSDIDTYHMAQSAMDEAVRRVVAVGGKLPSRETMLSVLDNFCWCDPEPSETNPDAFYKMAQLVRACKGIYDYATFFGIPFISGKDSMKNDSVIDGVRVSIPPTLLITALAKLDDAEKVVTMNVKRACDIIYILGLTKNELGGSEYYRYIGEKIGGRPYVGNSVPQVDLKRAKTLYEALSRATDAGLVHSVHTLTLGGLGVGLALIAFGGMLGLEVHLSKVPVDYISRNWELLFSESNGRFLVTVPEDKEAAFETTMAGNTYAPIGRVVDERRLRVFGLDGSLIIDAELAELKRAWKATMEEI